MPQRDIRYQAAIVRDHHILLVKVYDRTNGRQFWILPGGGREPDEDAETCLRREVREETGLDIEPGRLLLVTPDIPEGGYAWLHTYLCL
ncbi:MAG: NUDIX hydrolase, partial [Chloroflexia bacterium]|nr:NUDIX hydrolase [Chloroflexia bacterium]